MQCSQYYILVILCTVKKLTRPISWLWACSYQILMTIYTEQSINQMVKKCMEYEVEGPRPTGRPKRTWRDVVWEDCQARKLNKEDAMDRCKWSKMIKDVRWSGWVLLGECFFWYRPTRVVPDKKPLKSCVCVWFQIVLPCATLPLYQNVICLFHDCLCQKCMQNNMGC